MTCAVCDAGVWWCLEKQWRLDSGCLRQASSPRESLRSLLNPWEHGFLHMLWWHLSANYGFNRESYWVMWQQVQGKVLWHFGKSLVIKIWTFLWCTVKRFYIGFFVMFFCQSMAVVAAESLVGAVSVFLLRNLPLRLGEELFRWSDLFFTRENVETTVEFILFFFSQHPAHYETT